MWTLIKLLFWVTLGAAAAVVFVPEFLPELSQGAQEVLSSGGAGAGEGPDMQAASRDEMFPDGLGGGDAPYAGPAQGLERSGDRPREPASWEREERRKRDVRDKLRLLERDPETFQRELDRAYSAFVSANEAGDRAAAQDWYYTYDVYREALEIARQSRERPWR